MNALPALTCPSCRGVRPDGAFASHLLADDGRCPHCARLHPVVGPGLAVCLRPDDGDAVAMSRRAEAWAAAVVAGQPPPLAPAEDASWQDGAMVWAATHHGWMATPPLAPRPWPWLDALQQDVADAFVGPTLVLGGGAGGIVTQLPAASGPWVVLDSSPWSLALGAALATEGAQLPHRAQPWQLTSAPLAVPRDLAARLQQTQWLVADAHDPPYAAATFGAVVLVGVLDSVADPWLVLQQAEALLRPGGTLLIAAPWCDRADISPPGHWLSTLAAQAGFASPTDALEAGALVQERSLRVAWRRDGLAWPVRHHGRLTLHYSVDALLLRKSAV